ncbi:MAG: oligopeptide transporter, OPT family [Proteobacteria bacterium]|nr:oligopeptide transporter, OPT family [Pseudomonadota bacterium]
MSQSTSAPTEARTEFTLRGIVLGVIITLAFTAANVFFGLKAGLTFATSIPAAVISMALLRGFKNSTIQENNIVQTVASAAGTLSSIIFVLPGLVIIGWWTGFPYWVSFLICALGGILGVMYSIPLRRALVTNSDLPYPEGVACAEVLKVGSPGESATAEGAEESRAGLLAVTWGALVAAGFALVVATKTFASDVKGYFKVGDGVTGFDFGMSMALFAVGHLVGLWVGIAMLLGAVIGWGWGVPHFSALTAGLTGSFEDMAGATWSHNVRFVGAGTIGVAAIWTLGKLVKPVVSGLMSAMAANKARKGGTLHMLPRTEHDIPIGVVGLVMLACFVPLAFLLFHFSSATGLGAHWLPLVLGSLLYIVVMGFLVSTVCGYMAGLIGSSNSPLSGIGILVVIGAALLLVLGIKSQVEASQQQGLVAFALLVTSVVFTVAAIANNNLQDLKTGQLVDATPSKQQWALVVGVIAGSAIIPPILDIVNQAYGFVGAPGAGKEALAAPQAGLISALAQGVIQNNIDWSLITIGAGIGVVLIVIDELLRGASKGKVHLSPLAVGLGIYLPTSSTLMVVVGAIVGWWFDKRAERSAKPDSTKQLGVLLASGMIVGEGLIGVLIAGIVAFKLLPLQLVGDEFASGPAAWLGGVAFVVAIFLLYRWVERMARKTFA